MADFCDVEERGCEIDGEDGAKAIRQDRQQSAGSAAKVTDGLVIFRCSADGRAEAPVDL